MASGGRRPEHGGPPELVSCVALGRPVAAGSPCLNFSPYSPFLSRSFTTRMKPGNTYASKGVEQRRESATRKSPRFEALLGKHAEFGGRRWEEGTGIHFSCYSGKTSFS